MTFERKVPVQPGPGPWPGDPGGPGGPRPEPPKPGGSVEEATRSPLSALVFAALLIFTAVLFVPSPASAHGGDGRRAPCATAGAIDISPSKCGTAFIVGRTVWAFVTDKVNDGHCVRVEASHAATRSWFYVGQACPLGQNVQIVRTMHASSVPWNAVRIRDHKWVTLCGPGSGRAC